MLSKTRTKLPTRWQIKKYLESKGWVKSGELEIINGKGTLYVLHGHEVGCLLPNYPNGQETRYLTQAIKDIATNEDIPYQLVIDGIALTSRYWNWSNQAYNSESLKPCHHCA